MTNEPKVCGHLTNAIYGCSAAHFRFSPSLLLEYPSLIWKGILLGICVGIRRPGVKSAPQLNKKMFSRVDDRALYMVLEFHSNLGTLCFHGLSFVDKGFVNVEQV